MGGVLSQESIEDLLVICGTTPTIWNSHGNMQVCCPVHIESNPSMGVSSEKQAFNCFSCGAHGNFIELLHLSQPDQFPSYDAAKEFIEFNYDVSYKVSGKSHNVHRYEERNSVTARRNKRKEQPLYKIAPYKSGKETYSYFFKRGFDKVDMRKFMIGRDLVSKTVTIPCFYDDGRLAGVIGRYVSKNRKKNERYKVYDNFKRGNLLYPIDKVKVSNGTIYLVEGCFDAIRMYKLGYENTVAKMGVSLTLKQAEWIARNCDRVIDIADNDARGIEGFYTDKDILKNRVKVVGVDYPSYGKDVCDWETEDIEYMINNVHNKPLKRYV